MRLLNLGHLATQQQSQYQSQEMWLQIHALEVHLKAILCPQHKTITELEVDRN